MTEWAATCLGEGNCVGNKEVPLPTGLYVAPFLRGKIMFLFTIGETRHISPLTSSFPLALSLYKQDFDYPVLVLS